MEKSSLQTDKQQSEDTIEEITLFTEKKFKILQDKLNSYFLKTQTIGKAYHVFGFSILRCQFSQKVIYEY